MAARGRVVPAPGSVSRPRRQDPRRFSSSAPLVPSVTAPPSRGTAAAPPRRRRLGGVSFGASGAGGSAGASGGRREPTALAPGDAGASRAGRPYLGLSRAARRASRGGVSQRCAPGTGRLGSSGPARLRALGQRRRVRLQPPALLRVAPGRHVTLASAEPLQGRRPAPCHPRHDQQHSDQRLQPARPARHGYGRSARRTFAAPARRRSGAGGSPTAAARCRARPARRGQHRRARRSMAPTAPRRSTEHSPSTRRPSRRASTRSAGLQRWRNWLFEPGAARNSTLSTSSGSARARRRGRDRTCPPARFSPEARISTFDSSSKAPWRSTQALPCRSLQHQGGSYDRAASRPAQQLLLINRHLLRALRPAQIVDRGVKTGYDLAGLEGESLHVVARIRAQHREEGVPGSGPRVVRRRAPCRAGPAAIRAWSHTVELLFCDPSSAFRDHGHQLSRFFIVSRRFFIGFACPLPASRSCCANCSQGSPALSFCWTNASASPRATRSSPPRRAARSTLSSTTAQTALAHTTNKVHAHGHRVSARLRALRAHRRGRPGVS